MYPPASRQVMIAALVAVGVLALMLRPFLIQHQRAGGEPVVAFRHGDASQQSGQEVLVDVAGAVRHPGVYRLPRSARVLDAVRRAGGARRGADLAAINRAAVLVDGQQLLVPLRAPRAATGVASQSSTVAGAGMGPVSVNAADVASLDALPGIGPVTAQAIVADRQEHGPFRSVDDLDRVSGIGPATIERLRAGLTL